MSSCASVRLRSLAYQLMESFSRNTRSNDYRQASGKITVGVVIARPFYSSTSCLSKPTRAMSRCSVERFVSEKILNKNPIVSSITRGSNGMESSGLWRCLEPVRRGRRMQGPGPGHGQGSGPGTGCALCTTTAKCWIKLARASRHGDRKY